MNIIIHTETKKKSYFKTKVKYHHQCQNTKFWLNSFNSFEILCFGSINEDNFLKHWCTCISHSWFYFRLFSTQINPSLIRSFSRVNYLESPMKLSVSGIRNDNNEPSPLNNNPLSLFIRWAPSSMSYVAQFKNHWCAWS